MYFNGFLCSRKSFFSKSWVNIGSDGEKKILSGNQRKTTFLASSSVKRNLSKIWSKKKCFPLRIAIGALSVSSWRQIYLFEITFYNNLDNIWVIWEHLLSLSFTYKSHANFLQQTSLNNQHCKEIAGMCCSGLFICKQSLWAAAPALFWTPFFLSKYSTTAIRSFGIKTSITANLF